MLTKVITKMMIGRKVDATIEMKVDRIVVK